MATIDIEQTPVTSVTNFIDGVNLSMENSVSILILIFHLPCFSLRINVNVHKFYVVDRFQMK